MKVIDSQKLVICEDSDYKLSLQCQRGEGTPLEPRLLYRVILMDDTVHYVLAENAKGAISQATRQKRLEVGATADRLPFLIRGWGDSKF
mgnify:FL=1